MYKILGKEELNLEDNEDLRILTIEELEEILMSAYENKIPK